MATRIDNADVITFPNGRLSALPALKSGSSGPLVAELQRRLTVILGNAGMPGVEQTGEFDELTAEAVRQLQTAAGFTPTGMVDTNTWGLIVRATPMLGTPDPKMKEMPAPVSIAPIGDVTPPMDSGSQFGVGLAVVAAVGLGIYLLTRKSKAGKHVKPDVKPLSEGLKSMLEGISVPKDKETEKQGKSSKKSCRATPPPLTANKLVLEGQVIDKVEVAA